MNSNHEDRSMIEGKAVHVSDLPGGLSQPAQRALANAGLTSLEQVSKLTEREFKKLHGIGPKAVDLIRQALDAKGLTYKER